MFDSDFSNDSMKEMYLFESTALLDQLDDILLQSESDKGLLEANINEIFRIMHTIKGSSDMMSYDNIALVTHKLEDLFYYIRENGVESKYLDSLFDLMLSTSDHLKTEVEKVQSGEELKEDTALIARIEQFLSTMQPSAQPSPDSRIKKSTMPPPITVPKNTVEQPKSNTQELREAVSSVMRTLAQNQKVYHMHIYFNEGAAMENVRAYMLIDKLNELGDVTKTVPVELKDNPDAAKDIINDGFYLTLETSLPRKEIESIAKETLSVESVTFIDGFDTISESVSDIDSKSKDVPVGLNGVVASADSGVGAEVVAGVEIGGAAEKGVGTEASAVAGRGTGAEVGVRAEAGAGNEVGAAAGRGTGTEASAAAGRGTGAEASAAAGRSTGAEASAVGTDGDSGADASVVIEGDATRRHVVSKPIGRSFFNVDSNKIDSIMDLVGEIVTSESLVTNYPEVAQIENDDFERTKRELKNRTSELQDMIMSIRMMPISTVFNRMRRIVRDMGKDLGKDAELVIIGENTEIDKTVLDNIVDPIIHLVRNAMDHGIETREDRIIAGKEPQGRIVISAQNVGGEILVYVSDDGAGINKANILKKAMSKGMLEKEPEAYTDREIFSLLTIPSFSIQDGVTKYSGRGVGLDVVKENVEKINGSMNIQSTQGRGTNIQMRIPLTIALMSCMQAKVGDFVYSIPVSNIKESFTVSTEQLEDKGHVVFRDQAYEVIKFYELYKIDNAKTDPLDGIFILVDSGGRSACLFVDEVIGNKQVVIKPLPEYIEALNKEPLGISGCTIMGDGEVSLILDINELLG